jgi:GNAT superfamily N-acetyltransferase
MRIVPYDPSRKQDILDLNVWWIERYFGKVEPADLEEFDLVDDYIAQGGQAYFAVDDDGVALATCMAIPRGKDVWEIAKLGSDPDREHHGCGKAVFEACVEWARSHGARRIYILTKHTLDAAIHIYESHGFKRYHPEGEDYGGYDRGDYALEMFL